MSKILKNSMHIQVLTLLGRNIIKKYFFIFSYYLFDKTFPSLCNTAKCRYIWVYIIFLVCSIFIGIKTKHNTIILSERIAVIVMYISQIYMCNRNKLKVFFFALLYVNAMKKDRFWLAKMRLNIHWIYYVWKTAIFYYDMRYGFVLLYNNGLWICCVSRPGT